MILRLCLLSWFLALAPIAAQAAAPTSRVAIVDRAIEHHGGEIYRHSETKLELCSKSGCFKVAATVDGERWVFTVSGKSESSQLRVTSSNDSLIVERDGMEEAVAADRRQRFRDWAMARVYFCFLPYRLNDPSVYKQDLGLVDWDGRQLHKVKVTFEAGSSTDATDEYMYWFDPETARLEYLAYSYDDNGGGLRFRRAINHRRVGEILFFDQENFGVNGGGLSVDAIDAAYVRDAMRHISTVRLEGIKVRAFR